MAPTVFTVNGIHGPVVALFTLYGRSQQLSLVDTDIKLITLTGLSTREGKIDIHAWSKFSPKMQKRFIRLSKQGKINFACLGLDGTRKGFINEDSGRVIYQD